MSTRTSRRLVKWTFLGGGRAYAHFGPTRKMDVSCFHFRRRRRRRRHRSRCPSVHLVFMRLRGL